MKKFLTQRNGCCQVFSRDITHLQQLLNNSMGMVKTKLVGVIYIENLILYDRSFTKIIILRSKLVLIFVGKFFISSCIG